jgi:hypothetical protein
VVRRQRRPGRRAFLPDHALDGKLQTLRVAAHLAPRALYDFARGGAPSVRGLREWEHYLLMEQGCLFKTRDFTSRVLNSSKAHLPAGEWATQLFSCRVAGCGAVSRLSVQVKQEVRPFVGHWQHHREHDHAAEDASGGCVCPSRSCAHTSPGL